jgi:hypothetical protein
MKGYTAMLVPAQTFRIASSKEVAQIVVSDPCHPDQFDGTIHRFRALLDLHNGRVLWFVGALLSEALQKRHHVVIIGTLRISEFFVPVSALPRTVISPLLKSQSARVMLAGSPSLNPPKARNRTKSSQFRESRTPADSIACRNWVKPGSVSLLGRTLTRLIAAAGLVVADAQFNGDVQSATQDRHGVVERTGASLAGELGSPI